MGHRLVGGQRGNGKPVFEWSIFECVRKQTKKSPRFVCWPSKTYLRSKSGYCNLKSEDPQFLRALAGGYFIEIFLSMDFTLGKILYTKYISYYFLKFY